jgi:hypothetical protein
MTIPPETLAEALAGADRMLDILRHGVGEIHRFAGEDTGRGSQLVALDLSRTLVALSAADVALQRARRHAGLEVVR